MTMKFRASSAVLLFLCVALSWGSTGPMCPWAQQKVRTCCADADHCHCCKIKPGSPREQAVLQPAPVLHPAAGIAVALPSPVLPHEFPPAASLLEPVGSHSPPIYLAISQFLI